MKANELKTLLEDITVQMNSELLEDALLLVDNIKELKIMLNIKNDINNDDLVELGLKKLNEMNLKKESKEMKASNKKQYVTEHKGVKYLVNNDTVINLKNNSTMDLKSFENIISNKKGENNKFKDEWMQLFTNEFIDIFEQVSKNINNFEIFEDDISIQNESGFVTTSKLQIVIDKTNINDSFILRTVLETKKDGKIIDNMNNDGFSPYSIKNGITNTILFYGNIMELNEQILKALKFTELSDGVYINKRLEIITDLTNDYLYFRDIKHDEPAEKKKVKVFSFK